MVLVEIPPAIDSINTAAGKLYVDTSYNVGQYANVFATVLGVPDKINSRSARANKGKQGHFSPDEDMRLKVGDTVYFSYLAITNAKKNFDRGKYWEEDGKRFALLPYASLFFAVRQVKHQRDLTKEEMNSGKYKYDRLAWWEPEYIMLNQWLLIEPVGIKQHSETFERYGTVMIDDERSTGNIAVITDNPFKSSEGIVAHCPPGLGIEPGDNVIFQKESDIPVEYELCRTLDKPYWRMEWKDIVAKRNGRGVDLVDNYCLVIRDEPDTKTSFDIFAEDQFTGVIVQIGPKVTGLTVGQRVLFVHGDYVEFPHSDGRTGILVREGEMLMDVKEHKIVRV